MTGFVLLAVYLFLVGVFYTSMMQAPADQRPRHPIAASLVLPVALVLVVAAWGLASLVIDMEAK